jgi:hypothetical protein
VPALAASGVLAETSGLQGRTQWPGPRTYFASRRELERALSFRRPPPRLYPRYLWNAATLVAVSGLFIWIAYDLGWRAQPLAQARYSATLPMLLVGVIAYFLAARRLADYEAATEWALSEAPHTPADTEVPDKETSHGFGLIRVAIRRIWTQAWLIAISAVAVWYFVPNREGVQVGAALAQPQNGPVTQQHVERVARGEAAFYFPVPGGSLKALQIGRIYPSATLASFTTADNRELLALLLQRRSVEKLSGQEALEAVVYRPYSTMVFPELEGGLPRALVAMGTRDELTSLAKGRDVVLKVMLVGLVVFAIHALYIVTTLRRWLRVAFAKKGRIEA